MVDLTQSQRVRSTVVVSLGHLIEWYDFYVYAFVAIYFAASFFPEGDRTAQLLNTAGIYAVGFFFRPLGGWYFGRLADRRGRKVSILWSVLLMGFGSLAIAVMPTYIAVGGLAPALLMLFRAAQGFSTGGQYGAVASYLSEIGTDTKRGFYSSFQFVTLIGGQFSALALLLVLQEFLTEDVMRAWAWRLPFAVGAVLALAVLLLGRFMQESAAPAKSAQAGSLRELGRYPGAMARVIILSAAGNLCFFTFTTYMQKFLVNTAGIATPTVNTIMACGIGIFLLLQPPIGALSDRIGRRTCLLIFSAGMGLLAYPLLSALSTVQSGVAAFALVMTALVLISFYTSVSGLFKSELFPIHVRAMGVGIGHNLASALFGGSAEFVALYAKQQGHEEWFYIYVVVICAIGFVTALTLPRGRKADGEQGVSPYVGSPATSATQAN